MKSKCAFLFLATRQDVTQRAALPTVGAAAATGGGGHIVQPLKCAQPLLLRRAEQEW